MLFYVLKIRELICLPVAGESVLSRADHEEKGVAARVFQRKVLFSLSSTRASSNLFWLCAYLHLTVLFHAIYTLRSILSIENILNCNALGLLITV